MSKFTADEFKVTIEAYTHVAYRETGSDKNAMELLTKLMSVAMADLPKVRQNEVMQILNKARSDMAPALIV